MKEIEELKRQNQGYQKEIERLVTNVFVMNTKFTIIGIQNNWYNLNSKEYQQYTQEDIQFYSQKYQINIDPFKHHVQQLEKKTPTQRLEILQNYFQENPNNKLSLVAIMDLLKVSRSTAKRDMLLFVEKNKETYEIIKNPVIRKHKNQRKQTQHVISLQRKGDSI